MTPTTEPGTRLQVLEFFDLKALEEPQGRWKLLPKFGYREGTDWKDVLMRRSKVSAVKIKDGVEGLPSMTLREYDRWLESVSPWSLASKLTRALMNLLTSSSFL